jgi:hypothetical protein
MFVIFLIVWNSNVCYAGMLLGCMASGLLHIVLLSVIISLPWYNLSNYVEHISGLLS